MRKVNVHEAKTKFSQLLERAHAGEEIIIAKAGNPVARLTAYQANASRRKPGIWKGKVVIADDFDSLPRRVANAFRGEEP